MGLVRSTSLKRKRVSPSSFCEAIESGGDCVATTAYAKMHCGVVGDSFCCLERSTLESLPQEILIWILCGVEHSDLKRLLFISKAIREATLIAMQSHFAYTTPRKKTRRSQEGDSHNCSCSDIEEAPNAPKQSRAQRLSLSAKELASVKIALFTCDDVDD